MTMQFLVLETYILFTKTMCKRVIVIAKMAGSDKNKRNPA